MSELNKNLESMKKFENDLQAMELISWLLPKDKRNAFDKIKNDLNHLKNVIYSFNKYFADLGWCSYDSINTTLADKAVKAYESEGADAGEKVLIDYYTNDIKEMLYRLNKRAKPFSDRWNLINKAFEDHFAGRYYASIPLFLIIIDGSVNDFTKSKGFFADGTEVTAWDCIVGCDEGLTKIKGIFNKSRTVTNKEEIRMPYRNGILHGRDLNYANVYVSCKCVSLMFALADWMSMKNSEEKRKEDFDKKLNPPTLTESLNKHREIQKEREEINAWKKREVIIGEHIQSIPTIEDCNDYAYIIPLVKAFSYWESKNYGELSKVFKNVFSKGISDGKRAGECRKMFLAKKFTSFELMEIEERACSLTRILVQVCWETDEKVYSEPLEFGCVYESENGKPGLPWRNDGEWILIPWNIVGLYKK